MSTIPQNTNPESKDLVSVRFAEGRNNCLAGKILRDFTREEESKQRIAEAVERIRQAEANRTAYEQRQIENHPEDAGSWPDDYLHNDGDYDDFEECSYAVPPRSKIVFLHRMYCGELPQVGDECLCCVMHDTKPEDSDHGALIVELVENYSAKERAEIAAAEKRDRQRLATILSRKNCHDGLETARSVMWVAEDMLRQASGSMKAARRLAAEQADEESLVHVAMQILYSEKRHDVEFLPIEGDKRNFRCPTCGAIIKLTGAQAAQYKNEGAVQIECPHCCASQRLVRPVATEPRGEQSVAMGA